MNDTTQNTTDTVTDTAAQADEAILARVPSLRAYVARIGAVMKSFCKYVVESDFTPRYNNLREVAATITIKETDGGAFTVHCDVPVYEPTDGERAAILAEVTAAKAAGFWHHSLDCATEANLGQLKWRLGSTARLFVYRDITGSKILFVQRRVFWSQWKKARRSPMVVLV